MQREHIRRLTMGVALALCAFVPGSVTSAPPMAKVRSVTTDAGGLVDRAELQISQGRFADALSLLDEAIASNALSKEQLSLAYQHRGVAHQKTGDGGAAVLDYTKSLELGGLPVSLQARTHYNRALALSAAGDRPGAERDYGAAIELAPDYAPAWHNRANLERERQDYPTAIRDYGKALSLLQGDRRKLPLVGRALAYEKSGDLKSAAADLREAAAIDPNYGMAQAKLAEIESQLAAQAPAPSNDAIVTGAIAPGTERVERTVELEPKSGWKASAVRFEDSASPQKPPRTPEADGAPRVASAEPAEASAPAASTGRYRVQLGAFRGQEEAAKAWRKYSRNEALASLDHRVETADLGEKGTFYRLQAGGFESRSEARALCARLKADRIACLVSGG
jgi:tetratricopeptide (TPR) repeat protein